MLVLVLVLVLVLMGWAEILLLSFVSVLVS